MLYASCMHVKSLGVLVYGFFFILLAKAENETLISLQIWTGLGEWKAILTWKFWGVSDASMLLPVGC